MSPLIGFRRNIFLDWLDATAAFCTETDDAHELRARLEPIVAQRIRYQDNARQAIDILLNIWLTTGEAHRSLRDEAVRLFAQISTPGDRVCLHYGLTLLHYDFFRTSCTIIGQMSRYADQFAPADIKKRIFAELGQLGAANMAVDRVIFSLRNWGLLVDGERRGLYRPRRQDLSVQQNSIEQWLLAVALTAHQAEEIPFADLVRLPELFPFRFTLTIDDLRRSPRFEVHRQGLGWDMVRRADSFSPVIRESQ